MGDDGWLIVAGLAAVAIVWWVHTANAAAATALAQRPNALAAGQTAAASAVARGTAAVLNTGAGSTVKSGVLDVTRVVGASAGASFLGGNVKQGLADVATGGLDRLL